MEKFLDLLRQSYICRAYEDGFVLNTDIMYSFADHTFSFFIKEDSVAGFTITDRGETLAYLNECFDPEQYADKIEAICRHYCITREGDVFSAHVASYETNQTIRTFHMFVGAMHMIANIDLFD